MTLQATAFTVGSWTRDGFVSRAEKLYHIKDRETGQTVLWGPKLALRKAQKRHLKLLLNSLTRPGPRRVIRGKPRRLGISTATILAMVDMIIHTGWDAAIIAHDASSTQELMDIGRTAIHRMPPHIRPSIRNDTKEMITFGTKSRADRAGGDVGEGNKLIARTAGAKEPLSGAPNIRVILMSELAKWPGDEARQNDTFRSLIDALPNEGPSLAVIESTARGRQGLFYHLFTEAMRAKIKGLSHPWEVEFFAWYEDEGSYRPLTPEDHKHWDDWPKEDRDEERELVRHYRVTQEQLNFRRWKISEHGGDVDAFRQEFPSDYTSMFLQDGRSAIASALLAEQRRGLRVPVRVGRVICWSAIQPLNVINDPGGELTIWEEPIPGADYVVGGDASEARSVKSDHTSLAVFRRTQTDIIQVAEWYGRATQAIVGEVLADLGAFYNHALINVERNLSSLILHVLQERGYREDRLFLPTLAKHSDAPIERSYFTPKTRWNSKHLVNLLIYYLVGRSKRIAIRSAFALDELAGLSKDSAGEVETTGCDRAVAIMMAVTADSQWPMYEGLESDVKCDRWCPDCMRLVHMLACERCGSRTHHNSVLNRGVALALSEEHEYDVVGVPDWDS